MARTRQWGPLADICPVGSQQEHTVQMTQIHNTVFHLHCRACVKQLAPASSSSSTVFTTDRKVPELNMKVLHVP